MLRSRLDTQSRNLHLVLRDALRPGATFEDAAEHYSALLSPELFHLLTVVRGWGPVRYETRIYEILCRELLARSLRPLRTCEGSLLDGGQHVIEGRRQHLVDQWADDPADRATPR